ncbi:anthranilate phosphoribosyltransferase [Halovenus rubra]|uniref:Anthranilate phosphoribosyltransferase n=2 Tax=Halovenus rubra TaxID=869890 RepID=A0ACC7E2K8_9EURY
MTDETFGEWPLKRLLTERIGSGPRSAEDLTYDQAKEGFVRLLDGDPDPPTVSAFLLANRWKESTPAELAGFIDAIRDRSVDTVAPNVDPVDVGANYDGKAKTALLSVAAGLVTAAAGTPVVVHSGPRLPGKLGVTHRDVLQELGIRTDLSPAESARTTDEFGFGFYYQPRFNPGVDALRSLRKSVAVRTSINTVETLVNPAAATAHLGSFYHLTYAELTIEAVQRSETLSYDRILMFRGAEGNGDVRHGRVPLAELHPDADEIATSKFDPANLGFDFDRSDIEVDNVRSDSARATEAVLAGERTDSLADAVAVNAGIRIYAGGDVDSIAEGVEVAAATIDSGEAEDTLAALRGADYPRVNAQD